MDNGFIVSIIASDTVFDCSELGVNNITLSITDDGGNGPDPTPDNNIAAETTPLDAAPDLTITKDDGGLGVDEPGGDVEYTLVIQNTSAEPVTITELTDTINYTNPVSQVGPFMVDVSEEEPWASLR